MENIKRLVMLINDYIMEKREEEKPQAIIEVLENGPLKVKGNILFRDLKRDIMITTNQVYLCRCNKSGNKPYCDESHKK
jgi:CDGSH iron-sulfur domain-containing protein 3